MIARFFLLLLLPILLSATTFKVASYNVQNLFDDIRNGSEYDDYIPGKHNWTSRMVDIKLNHTAEVLCDLDADIVALQEIENESILIRLQKRLKRVGCSYPYRAITRMKRTAIHMALLSRFPILDER
jgi:endonuclease/exonuclease/phosphatase family metal-dependent hydrolase